MNDEQWKLVLEMRRIHDRLGSMRGVYLWIGIAAAILGVGYLVRGEPTGKTIAAGVVFLLTAVCCLLGRWRVQREPRLWTILVASIYTALGAVSAVRFWWAGESISDQGILFHYVVGVILAIGLWSIVPGKKTLAFLRDNAAAWDTFVSRKRPDGL